MNELPEKVHQKILSYLTRSDKYCYLSTSKQDLTELRRKTIYFSLNQQRSLEYVENPHFTSFILSRVNNGWKQISLRLEDINYAFPQDLPVHRISFYSILKDDLSAVGHIEHVKCVRIRMYTIPPIPKVKTLELENGEVLLDVKNLSHLERLSILSAPILSDITPLQNIPDLLLANCPSIESFHLLGQGKQINLNIGSSSLNDVSPFKNLHIASFCHCHQITDVSPLHGIYDLTLYNCMNISDISTLGKHHRLYIHKCGGDKRLIGYHSLYDIPIIELEEIDISDLSVLSLTKVIWLSNCPYIEDVTSIKNAEKVTIMDCPNVKNFHQLANIPDLSLRGVTIPDTEEEEGIMKVITFKNRELDLSVVSSNFNFLTNHIRELFIAESSIIEDFLINGVTILRNLQSLTLNSCPNFFHVKGLGSIPSLRLLYCPDLHDISALGGNRSVELAWCPLIVDVSSLATVPIVTIRRCQGIKDYQCLEKVPRLKLIPSPISFVL